jgi:flagellar hook-associated protein 1 FlgK
MTGTWDGITIALSALNAQKRGLDLTGQNIANANTDGYTRQRLNLATMGAPARPSIWATYQSPGTGVNVTGIDRLRDALLETRAQGRHAQLSDSTAVSSVLTEIEQQFPEPSDKGLQTTLNQFWSGFGDVSNNPGSSAARVQLLQRGNVVTDWLNTTATNLQTVATQQADQLTKAVASVNSMTSELADLNYAIVNGVVGGLPVNDLLDRRDVLAMKISEAVGGTISTAEDGSISIAINGSNLVNRSQAEPLGVGLSGGQTVVQWTNKGTPPPTASITTGQVNGLLTVINTTIPTWQSKLDDVAAALANKVNTQQAAGYDLDGNAGAAMFTGTTASTITMALTGYRQIAASSHAPSGGAVSLDGTNADAIANLATAADSPDVLYQNLVNGLGVVVQASSQGVSSLSAVVSNIDGQRESNSGVNLDEEMTNLLSYQRAYEAAGRMMSAVDSALDTLINRTGMVGR